jgi:predicted transcriptional regulator
MRMLRILDSGRATVLGPLENQIMDVLWSSSSPMTVSAVQTALGRKRRFSYSTIKAVLTNLAAKGHLLCKMEGRSNSFSTKVSRDEFQEKMIGDVLNSLMKDCRAPLLAHLVDGLAADPQTIRDIRRLLAKRMAELGKQ